MYLVFILHGTYNLKTGKRMKKIIDKENSITDIALKAGEIVLENGGETYRAEDTVVFTAKALGAKQPSSFITPTLVLFSFVDKDFNHHTSMHRIKNRVVNLKRLSQINSFSLRLNNKKYMQNHFLISSILKKIENTKEYSKTIMLLCAALSSFAFAFVFGGNLTEAVVAFFCGLLLKFFLIFFNKLPVNSFINSLCSGFVISVLAGLSVHGGIIDSTAIVSPAVLMQVVPGLALVNSIRDIIAGDLVSGTARLVEACMIAVGLSIGSVFGLVLV